MVTKEHSVVSTPILCSDQGSGGAGPHPVRSWNTSKERDHIINLGTCFSVQPSSVVNFCPLLRNQNCLYSFSLLPLVPLLSSCERRRALSSLHPPITMLHAAARWQGDKVCLHLLFSVLNRPRSPSLVCPSLHCGETFLQGEAQT